MPVLSTLRRVGLFAYPVASGFKLLKNPSNLNPLSLTKQKADESACAAKLKEDESAKCKNQMALFNKEADNEIHMLNTKASQGPEGEGEGATHMVYELMAKNIEKCEGDYKAVPEDKCEEAGKQLVADQGKDYPARGFQKGTGGTCGDGGWGEVPAGCALQTGGDWAPHFQGNPEKTCKNEAYSLICMKESKVEPGPSLDASVGAELCASFRNPYQCVKQAGNTGCAWQYSADCSPTVGSCTSFRTTTFDGVTSSFSSCGDFKNFMKDKGREVACAGNEEDKNVIIDKVYCGKGLPAHIVEQEKMEADEYDCQGGDVRLAPGSPLEAGVALHAEIRHKDDWYPICGHYLWDNDNAVSYICKRLGFEGGGTRVNWWGHGKAAKFSKDAMPIGKCGNGVTDLIGCNQGGNGWGDFNYNNGWCKAGKEVGIAFRCNGTPRKTGKKNSCGRIQLKYVQNVGHDWVTASCPRGLLAIGGGCDSAQHPWRTQANAPAKGGDFVGNDDTPWGWRCGGHGTRKVVWVVCSNLKDVKAKIADHGDWGNNFCPKDSTLLSGGCLVKGSPHVFSWSLSTGGGDVGTGWRCGGHGSAKKNWAVCSSDPRLKNTANLRAFKRIVVHGGDWNHVNCGPGYSVIGGGCDSTQPPHVASWMGPKMDGTGYLCGGHGNNKLGEARCINDDLVDRV